jgi:hypothetical protein
MGLQGGFQFCHTFAEELQDEEAEIRAQGDEVEHASLESFVNLIDAVGNFCNFDQKFDQAAEHFWHHMRNHLFVEASKQRKNGGSAVVLVVALYERMQRDYIASSSTKRFVKWFTDKAAMQNGLTNHTAALDIDGKGVCGEVIEELLLSASVTTANVDNCTAEWGEAEAFVTEQKKKSALTFFIQQARVEAAYRISLKRPGLQRQISSASSAPDSAFGSASSTCPSSGLSSAPDPAFGAHRFSDVEDGSSWGTAGEQAPFAARLRQGGEIFVVTVAWTRAGPFHADRWRVLRRDAGSGEGRPQAVRSDVDQRQPCQAEGTVPGEEYGERSLGRSHRLETLPGREMPSPFHPNTCR